MIEIIREAQGALEEVVIIAVNRLVIEVEWVVFGVLEELVVGIIKVLWLEYYDWNNRKSSDGNSKRSSRSYSRKWHVRVIE